MAEVSVHPAWPWLLEVWAQFTCGIWGSLPWISLSGVPPSVPRGHVCAPRPLVLWASTMRDTKRSGHPPLVQICPAFENRTLTQYRPFSTSDDTPLAPCGEQPTTEVPFAWAPSDGKGEGPGELL